MTKLKELGISSTDIESGVEHLPDAVKSIYHSLDRPESKVKKIS